MSTAIVPQATYTALTFNGTEAIKLDATGITEGGNWGRRLAQVVTFQTGAVATGTTITPNDDTIPQNTEGDQYMSLAITPTNASSTLEITVNGFFATSLATGNIIVCALYKDSVADALASSFVRVANASYPMAQSMFHTVVSGGVSAITFKVRAGAGAAGTTTFNGTSGSRSLGGSLNSTIIIKEYLP